MSFTVKNFLNLESSREIEPVCGFAGLENEIKGVTIIEAPDIVKYIKGGELLLTGLYAFKSCTMEEFYYYINELQRKQISGIIVKLGRDVEEAEKKIQYLRQFSENNAIPLMYISPEDSLQQILCIVMEHLFNEEMTQLKYFKTTHDNFSAVTLSMNKHTDRIGEVIEMLSKMINNPVALYDKNLVCYTSYDVEDLDFAFLPDAQQYDPGFLSNNEYFRQVTSNGAVQYYIRIQLSYGAKMYLVVHESRTSFSHLDCIAAENAIFSLQYVFSNNFAVSELEKKYRDDLLHNILHGNVADAGEMDKNISLLGLNPDASYRILIIGLVYEKRHRNSFDEMLSYIDFLEDVLRHSIPDGKFYQDLDRIAVLLPEDHTRSQLEYRERLRKIVSDVEAEIKKINKNMCIKAGAGKIVNGIEHISDSFREASDAFMFLDIVGDIVGEGNGSLMLFSDLGIFKLLCQMDDTDTLMEYVPESLRKLHDYKKSQRDDLLLTLKTYLDRNQNLSKAAQDLFIHYKTAVYRMDKITQITGIDFNDANEVLAVRIGLVVYQMIQKKKNKH